MTRRRSAASIVASPVLVGAVTVLIATVAVFLAYNANNGLPFVPTYLVRAEAPNGSNLVKGNEVRVGGFRVGVVEKIGTRTTEGGRAIALLDLKLDKTMEPIAADSQILIRPRSALGLKYVELTPGRSREKLDAGSTLPLSNASTPTELDDFLKVFNQQFRDDSRTALKGFGDALASRGPSLNASIGALGPFFRSLEPVMRTLNDPETELDEFFKQIGRAAAEVAPVARTQAELFTNMADTFEAFSRYPESLRATIEGSPPTLDVATRSFRVQRPFLIEFTDVSRRLRPAARELPRSLPAITRAFAVGRRILPRTVALNQQTADVFRALDDLTENPNTLLALEDITSLITVGEPLLNYVNPYITVCNYWNYFWHGLGEHFSEGDSVGTVQRTLFQEPGNETQDNRVSGATADRPADVPTDVDPQRDETRDGMTYEVAHGQPYGPAVDAQGNADCQTGQWGYLNGPLTTNGRYPPAPSSADFEDQRSGGSHVALSRDTPGLAGPTFTGRKSLKDVP